MSCPSLFPKVCSNLCPSSQWCHPTISSFVVPFSSCLQSFPVPVFSNDLTLNIKGQKYWSFSFSISPSNNYSGLISFRIDWSLYYLRDSQESSPDHNLKALILRCSAFFMFQLSHQYMTTGKMIALTRQTFVTMWYLCLLIHCVSHKFFFLGASLF